MKNKSTLFQLVTEYASALGKARPTKQDVPIIATDLSLYLDRMHLWFDGAMVVWSYFVSNEVRRGKLIPPSKRNVVRYAPLKHPEYRHIAEAKEYWLHMKTGLHWMLCPGPYNLITFGELQPDLMSAINYALIPGHLLVESPGIFNGDFQTRIERGNTPTVRERASLVQEQMLVKAIRETDPKDQHVFPLYYVQASFRAKRIASSYSRDVLGRFLWKLQRGICADCGFDIRHSFSEMDLDHVLPLSKGGNNTLLNTELKCADHNNEKNNRISETQDYRLVLDNIIGVPQKPELASPFLSTIFSLKESSLAFPVRFPLGIAQSMDGV